MLVTRNPLQRLFGGSRAAVLEVLIAVDDELTARRIARLAAISEPAAGRALSALVEQQVVTVRSMGTANFYRIAEHSGIREALASFLKLSTVDSVAVATLLQNELQMVAPQAIILFGSVARGDETPESDLDLLVVVPSTGDPTTLQPTVDEAAARVGQRLGRRVQILATTWPSATGRKAPFWRNIASEGRLIHGTDPLGLVKHG